MIVEMLRGRSDGLPVYGYRPVPGIPPVGAVELAEHHRPGGIPPVRLHAHDFFVVVYVEAAGGALRVGSRDWAVAAGDVYLIAPGDVVGPSIDDDGHRSVRGWAVCFAPEVVVDQVTRLVGYRDPSYFARTFRRHHGTTPLGWRQAARSRGGGPTGSARSVVDATGDGFLTSWERPAGGPRAGGWVAVPCGSWTPGRSG